MFRCFALGFPCQLELLSMTVTFLSSSSASTLTLSLFCETVFGKLGLLSSHLGLRLPARCRFSHSIATRVKYSLKRSNYKSQRTLPTSKSAYARASKSCLLTKISTTSWMSKTSPSQIHRHNSRLARRLRLITLFHSPFYSNYSNLISFKTSIHMIRQHKATLMV